MVSAIDSDPERGGTAYRGRLARDGYSSFTTAIVKAIAAVKGKDPTDADLRLADSVHPEAINTLYEHTEGRRETLWELTFVIDEFNVTVRSDGYIEIR